MSPRRFRRNSCARARRPRRHRARAFEPGDVTGKALVYAATGDEAANASRRRRGKAANIPVNVVDEPDVSTFITPAIVDRDPLTIAIGTEGAAPVLARNIRAKLEAELPARLGEVAAEAGRRRDAVEARIGEQRDRRRVYERLLAGEFRRAVLDGDTAAADAAFEGGTREGRSRGRQAAASC